MKIIIYGANETSSLIATEFFEDHDVVVMDDSIDNLSSFSKLDIATVMGSACNVNTLKEAEIKETDLFIACTTSDESNIVSCMMAKSLAPNVRTVCFVSEKECYDSLEILKKETKTNVFTDNVIWPVKLLTKEIFEIVTVPEALDAESFANDEVRLLEYRIKEDSPINGKMIKDCAFAHDTLIVGIVRDDELSIPNGLSELKTGDKVIFMGTLKGLNQNASEILAKKSSVKSAFIIGGGSVGFELAKLLGDFGIKVKIVEKNYKRCEFLSENLKNTLVLHGNGTDANLLAQEGIEEADVTICTTDSDEKNLLCSLIAKQNGVKRVIARASHVSTASLFEKVGIDIAISAKEASLNEIKNKEVDTKSSILATVEKGLAEIVEIKVRDDFQETMLKDLKLPAPSVIAIIMRQNKVIIPNGMTLIRGEDKLVVFVKSQDVSTIREFWAK